MTNVLVVEDSRIIRDVVVNKLEEAKDYTVIAAIENAANAEILCLRGQIDLIIMDVCTSDDESGLDAARRIKVKYPQIKVIIMTSMPEYSFVEKAGQIGCEGFWYKEYGDTGLLEVCNRVMDGEIVYPEDTPSVRVGLADSKEFTEREFEIIRELTLGKQYGEIAEDLDISLNTVKYHIKNIMQKTGYQNSVALVADVVEKRLILPKY